MKLMLRDLGNYIPFFFITKETGSLSSLTENR
nr:MAG TPA: hypothetical protein [Caudoviricetes sp.]